MACAIICAKMKKTDAIQHFGTQVALAAAIGVDQSTISKSWGEYPPPLRQLQLEALTGGLLKAEASILPKKKKKYGRNPVNCN